MSPRRKPTGVGGIETKDLTTTHAAHECLSFLIQNYKALFSISTDRVAKCNFNYIEESKPVSLQTLGDGNWKGYLYESVKATLKEGRER